MPKSPAWEGPSSGKKTDDLETFRCLRCGDTGLVTYFVQHDDSHRDERQLRCFCEAGAARNPELPCVDDVVPPLRRHNLRIKLYLGRLCAPRSYLPLVWDEENDTPVTPHHLEACYEPQPRASDG